MKKITKIVTKENQKTRRKNTRRSSGGASSAPFSGSPDEKERSEPGAESEAWDDDDLNSYRQLLQKLMEDGEFRTAGAVAKHLTNLQPGDAYAWYLRGVVLISLSDPQNAEGCLLKSMEIAGTDAWDCYHMGICRLLRGDMDGAILWCSRAVKMDPDKLPLRWKLMEIHTIQGDLKKAIAAGKTALGKAAEPTDRVRTHLELAKLYLALPAFADAEANLKAALELQPDNAELWSLLGHCLSRQDKWEPSLKAFQQALVNDPRDEDNAYNIGDTYLGLKQPEKAIPPLLRTVWANPGHVMGHYDLSLAYLQVKQYQEAEKAARAALRSDPEMEFQRSNPGLGSMENLGVALMNQGKLKEAEACFRKNLALVADTYSNLGLTLFRMKRYDEALENLQRALALEPENPEYNNLLGDTYDEMGQFDEAEKYLRRAVEIDPGYALGHYDLGVFFSRRKGKKEESLAAFGRALKNDPDMAQAYYGIACTHILVQEKEMALKYLEKALQEGFDDFDWIEEDSDWDGLRSDAEFRRLVAKYRKKDKTDLNIVQLPDREQRKNH